MLRKFLLSLVFVALYAPEASAQTFYVDFLSGSSSGNGSEDAPWDTITTALDNVPDGSTVIVRPGTYNGRVRIRGSFPQGVLVKAEIPYQTRLRHTSTVVTAYENTRSGCNGITLEGFDIAHSGPGAGPLVVQIEGGGTRAVHHITLRNNILHDSYNNDLLKINHSASDITVSGNIFYNQTGSDEHIDINSVENVVIEDNVFFNNFAGSGRMNDNNTSSYIVVKDSDDSDIYTGSQNITIRRNVFLNWEGSTGSTFVLLGEDGNSYYEVHSALVENNLFLGNSSNIMRSSFGVKGGRDIVFRSNTIVGDLPSRAFAMRLNTEGSNPINDRIFFYNNIWSDPTGTMGAVDSSSGSVFSDTIPGEVSNLELDNNMYWNGGQTIPSDNTEVANYTDDSNRVVADPILGDQSNLQVPHWDESEGLFRDGSTTIRQVFERLVINYGKPGSDSQALDAARADEVPADDILGHTRTAGGNPDIGAVELASIIIPNPPTDLNARDSE